MSIFAAKEVSTAVRTSTPALTLGPLRDSRSLSDIFGMRDICEPRTLVEDREGERSAFFRARRRLWPEAEALLRLLLGVVSPSPLTELSSWPREKLRDKLTTLLGYMLP